MNAQSFSRSGFWRRQMVATCMAAFVTMAGLGGAALAQGAGPLDTSTLPRPAAVKSLVALPQTTIILSSESVPAAAKAALALLQAQGWQVYGGQNGPIPATPQSETHSLKKGGHALTLFVQMAPAHNNATSISYTAVPLERDLPFPAAATDIRFSPERLYLDARTGEAPEALLALYRAELTKQGWGLHSASDGSAAMKIPAGEGQQHGFFTHPQLGALHVSATRGKDGQTALSVRKVPAGVLPGAQAAKAAAAPPPAPAQPSPHLEAHQQMNKMVDGMAQDMMRQALATPPQPMNPMAEQALAKALAAQNRAKAETTLPASKQAMQAPAAESRQAVVLEREDYAGMPVPKPYTSRSNTKSKWRQEVTVSTKGSLDSVLAFYRKELVAMGWQEADGARIEADRATLTFTRSGGPVLLNLTRKGGATEASLLLRDEAGARQGGLWPQAGQATVMLGSMMDAETTVSIGGKSIRVAAGAGSKSSGGPGPSLAVGPGKHKVTIKESGKPAVTDEVSLETGEIWGLMIGPGGVLPLQMY